MPLALRYTGSDRRQHGGANETEVVKNSVCDVRYDMWWPFSPKDPSVISRLYSRLPAGRRQWCELREVRRRKKEKSERLREAKAYISLFEIDSIDSNISRPTAGAVRSTEPANRRPVRSTVRMIIQPNSSTDTYYIQRTD